MLFRSSSFILMFLVLALAIAFGPLLCGWICPLGSFQEWLGKIGKKISGKKYNHIIPTSVDRVLRYGRYIVLAAVLYFTAIAGTIISSPYDPYLALYSFWTDEAAIGGIIILGIIMLLALITERPWCKYACPLGAVLGFSNRFRIFKIKRKSESCISCGICDKRCPMNIQVSECGVVRDDQCISCYECTSEKACPVADTVVIEPKKPGFAIKSWVAATAAFVIIFGGIGVAKASDLWATNASKQMSRYVQGNSGNFDPSTLRGSLTLGLTADIFGIPLEDLAKAFGVPLEIAADFENKNLETAYDKFLEDDEGEIGNHSLKFFVSLYTGAPVNLTESTYLLQPGVEILKEKANLTEEQLAYLEDHTLYLSESQIAEAIGYDYNSGNISPGSSDNEEVELVKGSTTFGEILDLGVSEEAIERIIGGELPKSFIPIKDYCDKNGLSFGVIKQELNNELTKL